MLELFALVKIIIIPLHKFEFALFTALVTIINKLRVMLFCGVNQYDIRQFTKVQSE